MTKTPLRFRSGRPFPSHTPPSVTTWALKSPVELWGPQSGHHQSPPQELQEGRVLCAPVRHVDPINSRRPVPDPEVQWYDPLVHWGELQNMAAELVSCVGGVTSLPPPTSPFWAAPGRVRWAQTQPPEGAPQLQAWLQSGAPGKPNPGAIKG